MSFLDYFRRRRTADAASDAAPQGLDPLQRFRDGDERAFDELVDAFSPGMIRLFRRHGVDASTSEDLAQEVFVRLLRTRANYEGRGRLQVYLYRIAHNVWRDWQRAHASHPAMRSLESTPQESDLSLGGLLAHPAIGPAEALSSRESSRVLSQLLRRLSEGERLVLELALFERLPYAQIADALHIPEGTVKSRVFHALRKLRAWSTVAGEVAG